MRLPVTSYDLRSRTASSSELVNCYVESLPADARAPYLIRRCAGLKYFHDNIQRPIAAMSHYRVSDKLTVVSDDGASLAVTSLTGASVSAGTTAIASTGFNIDIERYESGLIIVAEPTGYTLTGVDGNTLTQISDADFTARGAGDVEFLDNFMLFREPSSGRFFGSDVGAFTDYTSLNFATAEADTDNLVGMKSDRAQVVLFGEKTAEIWDTTGGSGFPFRRMINGAINKGAKAARSIVLVDGFIYWVAEDNTVRVLRGLEPVKISNPAIEQTIADKGLGNVSAFTYRWEGHNFYVLRTPEFCFAYDTSTGQWHTRKSIGSKTWHYGASAEAHGRVYFGAQSVVPDQANDANRSQYPVVYMDNDTFTENERQASIMQWTYQPVWGQGQRVFHNRLEIVLETGAGTAAVQDPLIHLEFSDDQGDSWVPCANREIGSYGEKFQRPVWNNLGAAYQRIYRASVSDAVPIVVTDTLLNAKGGSV